MAQGRSLWSESLKNLINSLKPRRYLGELRGEDYLGNKYYEAPSSSYGGRQRRWFVPPNAQEIHDEVPTEWEAWLRHKRKVPPTEEEIQLNLLKVEKVKEIARLETQRNKTEKVLESESSKNSFPQYEEYSTEPFSEQKGKKST